MARIVDPNGSATMLGHGSMNPAEPQDKNGTESIDPSGSLAKIKMWVYGKRDPDPLY